MSEYKKKSSEAWKLLRKATTKYLNHNNLRDRSGHEVFDQRVREVIIYTKCEFDRRLDQAQSQVWRDLTPGSNVVSEELIDKVYADLIAAQSTPHVKLSRSGIRRSSRRLQATVK